MKTIFFVFFLSFSLNLNAQNYLKYPTYWFHLSIGEKVLTKEQLKEYRFYLHKAISIFEKIAEINPEFQTIVGNIRIKAYNEYFNSFLATKNNSKLSEVIYFGLNSCIYIN